MLEEVAKTIARYSMFQPDRRSSDLVSGGADSVCLLHVLRDLAPRWNLRLTVLHLDHQLRGAESRQDAAFVRDLAVALDLPFELQETDVAALCRETGENLEQAARAARLAFFQRLTQAGTVNRIATGHTRSDQAETVLFRFLRGSGTAGLAGIRPVTGDGIVRPLLEIGRPEIEWYLAERGIAWRNDSTNASAAFARNRDAAGLSKAHADHHLSQPDPRRQGPHRDDHARSGFREEPVHRFGAQLHFGFHHKWPL